MRIFRLKRVQFVALLVLGFLVLVPSVASVTTQTDAASRIASSQNLLASCYNAAKAAEAAGANITVLQVALNDGGESLSNAELAYSNGDYISVIYYANQCDLALSNFVLEANALKASGEQQRNQSSIIFVGSIVGAFVMVGAGYVVWLRLKKKYTN